VFALIGLPFIGLPFGTGLKHRMAGSMFVHRYFIKLIGAPS
jgi:hypothetical protein